MSIWSDIQKRSSGETVREEDQQVRQEIQDFKKKIKEAAKYYVEEYIDAMFDSGYSVKEIQDHYEVALMDVETYWIVERLEKEDRERFWDLNEQFWDLDEEYGLGEEIDLEDYAQGMLKHFADTLIPALKEDKS